MLSSFIKVTAKAKGVAYKAIVAVDHIGSILESSAGGCQIVCKNGDLIPVGDDIEEVEKMIKKAQGENVVSAFA